MPQRHGGWFARLDKLKLYHVLADLTYNVYSCTSTNLCRQWPTYSKVRNEVGDPGAPLLASIEFFDNWFVGLVSVAPVPQTVETHMSFFDTLQPRPNQSLWKHFKYNDTYIRLPPSSAWQDLSFPAHARSCMQQVLWRRRAMQQTTIARKHWAQW